MAKSNGKPKPKPKPKLKSSKGGKPFWTNKYFIGSVLVIVASIVLQNEQVAIKIDDLLGTTTSQTRRLAAEQAGYSLMNMEAESLCKARPGVCSDAPTDPNESFQITVINKSSYRADIYWQNADGGPKVVANVEGGGSSLPLTVFSHNQLTITRHGVKEPLVDPETDQPHKFRPTKISQVFVIPASAAPSTNKCRDRFEDMCENYAKAGECWNRPGWMIVHCCQSCDKYNPELEAPKLIDYNVRCTKENMNITEPVWKPGDLENLFRKWTTDPEFQKYDPQILSSPDTLDNNGNPAPWAITFDNFFTPEEATALMEGGKLAGFDRSTNQGAVNAQGEMEKVLSQTRTSSNAWCINECQELPGVQSMTKRIEAVTGIMSKNYEPFQVLEYQDNQFYKMHHDSEGRDLKPPGNRILTFFLYLTDVEEGGETMFNKLGDGGLKVKPKLGRALIWPSVLDDEPDFWDDRMYHEAMPVIKGVKYAANHWIHLNDFEGPSKWGCTGSFQ